MKFFSFMMLLSFSLLFTAKKSHAATRVVMIGDSQAFLLQQPDALPAALGSDFELHSFARGGTSLISWAAGAELLLLRRALALRPDVLLVVLGTNDACMGLRIVRNELPLLRSLLQRLQGVRVVWAMPPKLPARCQAAVPAFEAMLRGEGVDVIGQPTGIAMWTGDVHPSERGRRDWARWLTAELRRRVEGLPAVPKGSAAGTAVDRLAGWFRGGSGV